jgi:hypothetical protein
MALIMVLLVKPIQRMLSAGAREDLA